jgi:hypothetical protein
VWLVALVAFVLPIETYFLPVTAGDLLPSSGEPRCSGTRAGMTDDG